MYLLLFSQWNVTTERERNYYFPININIYLLVYCKTLINLKDKPHMSRNRRARRQRAKNATLLPSRASPRVGDTVVTQNAYPTINILFGNATGNNVKLVCPHGTRRHWNARRIVNALPGPRSKIPPGGDRWLTSCTRLSGTRLLFPPNPREISSAARCLSGAVKSARIKPGGKWFSDFRSPLAGAQWARWEKFVTFLL